METTFNKVLNWIVASSTDPEKLSMTIQGVALYEGSKALDLLSKVGLGFNFDKYTHDVAIASAVIGVCAMIYGGIRKIVFSFHNSMVTNVPTIVTTDPIVTVTSDNLPG